MSIYPTSLKQKTLIAYIIGGVLMFSLAFLNCSNLNKLEDMIISGQVVSDLFATTLEIRGFEKNYFLYGKKDDYENILIYLDKIESILKENGKDIAQFHESAVYGLEDAVMKYRDLLKSKQNRNGKKTFEKQLREKGKAIVSIAKDLSETERIILASTLRSTRNIVVGSMIFFLFGAFLAGGILYRMFIKPLRIMQKHMEKVATGDFSSLSVKFRDKELVTINNAFNKMLAAIESRQKMVIAQSDKLAALGTMVSGITHELNNPLSNIFTSCQILQEEIEGDDISYKKELLQQIEKEVEKSKSFVSSLLQFSRKKKEFKSEIFHLRDLIKDVIKLLKGDMPTEVTVTVSIPEHIRIVADKQRIEHAILNIVKNGIEAIHGEGTVSINAKEDPETKTVEMKIHDTGVGIEPNETEKIFDPFFTTKAAGIGTGLGLYVTREIIIEHGGTIEADSEIEKGTTFTIRLPES